MYAIRASAFMWIKLFYKQIYFIRCTRIKYKRVRVTFGQIFVKCFKNGGFILFEDVISNCGEILIEVITYLFVISYYVIIYFYAVGGIMIFRFYVYYILYPNPDFFDIIRILIEIFSIVILFTMIN